MTSRRLEDLRRAALAAKPGPYRHGEGCCGPFVDYHAHEDERSGPEPMSNYDGCEPVWLGGQVAEADRAYFAALSPDVALALLAVAEASEAMRARCADIEDQWGEVPEVAAWLAAVEALRAAGVLPPKGDEWVPPHRRGR